MFEVELIRNTAIELLYDFIHPSNNLRNNEIEDVEIKSFATHLINEAFQSDQSKIDKKIDIFFIGFPELLKKLSDRCIA